MQNLSAITITITITITTQKLLAGSFALTDEPASNICTCTP